MDTDTVDPATQDVTDPAPAETQNSLEHSDDDGTQRDSDQDTVEKRLADKDRYITQLQNELKSVKKPAKQQNDPHDDTLWLIEHATELKQVKQEYNAYLSKGYDREDALRLAKLDKGVKVSGTERQAAHSNPESVVDRSIEPSVSAQDKRDMELWGFSEETLKRHKQMKAERV